MGSVECVTCQVPATHSAVGGESDAGVFFAPASVCEEGGRIETLVGIVLGAIVEHGTYDIASDGI
jgi:hypothetical protein